MQLLNQQQLRNHFKDITGKRVSTPIIKKLLAKGLPSIILGKRRFFDVDKVDQWLTNQNKGR